MKATKHVTMRVRHKGSSEWEAAVVDVPISPDTESGFWEQLAQWTERRVAAYPPETWVCETIVADEPLHAASI